MKNICNKFTDEGTRIETIMRDIFTYDSLRIIGKFVATKQGTQLPITRQVIVDHIWLIKDEVKNIINCKYNSNKSNNNIQLKD